MKIHELLEGDFVDLTRARPAKGQKAFDWRSRTSQLQARCDQLLPRLIQAAGPQYEDSLKNTRIQVGNLAQYANADAGNRLIMVDVTVFWDANDETLAWVIAHELGHIALGHVDAAPSNQQSRQDEYDADDFATDLAKNLGYSKARVFRFMHSKQKDYDEENAWASKPDSTHPNFDQRIDRAGQKGFTLSRGGQEQLDTLMRHMA